jgi:hypothetical protein
MQAKTVIKEKEKRKKIQSMFNTRFKKVEREKKNCAKPEKFPPL